MAEVVRHCQAAALDEAWTGMEVCRCFGIGHMGVVRLRLLCLTHACYNVDVCIQPKLTSLSCCRRHPQPCCAFARMRHNPLIDVRSFLQSQYSTDWDVALRHFLCCAKWDISSADLLDIYATEALLCCVQTMCKMGYSSMDIISVLFRVVRNFPDLAEFLKLEFIRVRPAWLLAQPKRLTGEAAATGRKQQLGNCTGLENKPEPRH